MDETEEINRLCVRALVAQMGAVPGVELHLSRSCALGLTGEPSPDFNLLTLGDDPDVVAFLNWSVERARARGLPLIATMTPRVASVLAPVVGGLGLTAVGSSPLMVLRKESVLRPARPIRVSRVLGPDLVAMAGDLAAAAFETPRDLIARCIDVCVTEDAGVETYLGWEGETPVSAVTMTPSGNTAGVTLMATSPDFQRRGAGRALLTQVIGDFRGRGIERFYLGASAAGRPLYESMGFATIAALSAWLLPPAA